MNGCRVAGRGALAAVAWLALLVLSGPSRAAGPVFREVAGEVGLDFVHFNGMVGKLYFAEVLGGGVALFDYDADGDLDVYLGQGSLFEGDRMEDAIFQPKYPLPLTDRLYRNDLEVRADGSRRLRFTDVTDEAELASGGYNMSVSTGDYDNDGDLDLYISNLGSNSMLRNNGDGTFTDVTEATRSDDRRWSVAASFFDYDRDGWLDLFVGNYTEFRVALHKVCTSATGAREYCGPLSYGLEQNTLLHNGGDGVFENVSARALLENRPGSTLGVVVGDFDDNGLPDVYVANDQVENQMWMNQGDGTFVDDALFSGSAVDAQGQPQASMGVVAGDLNGDGYEDLFMSHLNMEMNTMYVNDGTGLFSDASANSGLGRASWSFTGFGTALFDYDNDTIIDLYVANGAVKRIEEQLRAGDPHPVHETNLLFHGLGGGRFEEVPAERRIDHVYSEVSRGVAAGDLDNDGDTDLVVSNNGGPVRVLLNAIGQDRPWLGLRLMLRGERRDAFGAKVGLYRKAQPTQWRRVKTDGSYISANDPRVLFGLGDAVAEIEKVTVRWPNGKEEVFDPKQVEVGAYTTLVEGSGRTANEN